MKIVVITDSKKVENESFIVTQMFEAGLETLHVRKIRYSTKELDAYIKAIPSHFHNRIVIHSHHKLATKYNLKGIHFTTAHLERKFSLWLNLKILKFRKPNLTKSMSFKRVSDIYTPQKIQTDYCFLGTMFHNISGELYSGFYKETVEAAIQKSGKMLYARGGINEKSIHLAHNLGFKGVALYGHVWKSTSPYVKYIDFIKYCKSQNIPIE